MTDGDLLLAAILDHPEDDTLRLIYADAIEEAGEVDRAEFIRVQVELAKMGHDPQLCHKDPCDDCAEDYDRYVDLCERGESILADNYHKWHPEGFSWMVWPAGVSVLDWLNTTVFRRGFIDTITTTFELALDHLPAIVRRHPIQPHAGMVTDREPFEAGGDCIWTSELVLNAPTNIVRIEFIPDALCEMMLRDNSSSARRFGGNSIMFATPEAARLALATAMIAQARAANLTPKEAPV